MLGLITHCGARHAERAELGRVPLPAATKTHVPIPHDYFVDLVEDRLNDQGLRIVQAEFALNHEGANMFGIMEVGSANDDDFATIVGLRNSHIKLTSAGLVLGKGVFVCDNLCFSGEFGMRKVHRPSILDDLPRLVTEAVAKVATANSEQLARAEAYKEKQISNKTADHLIMNMLRAGAINTQRVEKVVAEWDAPSHEEFKKTGRSVWRLEQAATESLKGLSFEQMSKYTQRLVPVLDKAADFESLALAA